MSHHHLTPPRHHHTHAEHDPQDGLVDLLDLDAEVLADPLKAVRADIERLVDAPVRSILDLGAGTGTGTFGLLSHFADSHVVAIDTSEQMLEHLRARAETLGLTDRVTTVCADLDVGVPELEPMDLAWASASLHHLADPDRTLAQVVASIRPGGVLAVLELAGFPRFVPDDSTGGAAEARAHELLAADRAVDMPTMGADWGARLSRAGLVVEMDRTIVIELTSQPAAVVGSYAAATLTRVRSAVADRLVAHELHALDTLLDGGAHDVRRRGDLRVDTERRLWIARRPARSTP